MGQNSMTFNSLEIKNFRCFSNYKIGFAPETTVLIGKNGEGKTTVIDAIKQSLSFLFSKDKSIASPASASAGYLNMTPYSKGDAFFCAEERDHLYPIQIKAEATLLKDEAHPLDWALTKNSASGKIQTSPYKKAYTTCIELMDKTQARPIFAYFSDSYPHIKSNVNKEATTVLKSSNPLPRNFGYYEWDAETSCTLIWRHRFINVWEKWSSLKTAIDLIKERIKRADSNNTSELTKEQNTLDIRVKETKAVQDELIFIAGCIKQFSASTHIANQDFEVLDIIVDYRGSDRYVEFLFANGDKTIFDNLPAGYKRIFSMVFDIAYRSFTLNGASGLNDIFGIVLIDEIDLHLHPTLEQEVLQRLKSTFPNVQFIVTTHSPLVISNFAQDEKNQIIRMTQRDGVYNNDVLPNIFGIDYNTSLTGAMNTPARPLDLDEYIDDFFILKDQGSEKEARAVYQKIVQLTGADSDTIQKISERLRLIE